MQKENSMDEVKIFYWLHDYEWDGIDLGDSEEDGVLFSKLLIHIHKKQHTCNLHNKVKFIMLDSLANELEIEKSKVIDLLRVLKKEKYICLEFDDYGFRVTEHNSGFAKALGLSGGYARCKAYLTHTGEVVLKKLCNKNGFPFLRNYVEIIG